MSICLNSNYPYPHQFLRSSFQWNHILLDARDGIYKYVLGQAKVL